MSQDSPLTGQSLTDLLDRARDLLHDNTDSSITYAERQSAVAELLRQHSLAPTNLRDMGYLHWLWLQVEQPAEANAALHRHRAAVLANPGADSRTAFTWELLNLKSRWHIQQQKHLADHSEGTGQLAALLAQLHANPVMHEEHIEAWGEMALQYQAWDLMEVDLQWQYRQPRDEDIPAAWHEALFHRRMAGLFYRRGDENAMEQHIHTAIAHLQTDNESITLPHWLQLAQQVLQYAPQHVEIIVQAARAQLCGPVTADATATDNPFRNPLPSPAQRHYRLGLLARVQAQAHHALGEVEQALACAQAGLYDFDEDDDDIAFAAQVMQWHANAGHKDAAADLAAAGLLHVRNGWVQPAWRWVLGSYPKETEPQRLALLWCLLAWPGIDSETRQLLQGDEEDGDSGDSPLLAPPHPPETCLARARQYVPHYPLADWMEGVHLALQQQWQAALPLLEKGTATLPQHSNFVILTLLWGARLLALPAQKAMARPLPVPLGATWGYAQGVILDQNFQERLHQYVQEPHRSRLPALESLQAPLQALAQRSYETAIAQFEAFFASGQGHYKSASPHTYAMLCHNLSILLEPDEGVDWSQSRQAKAMEAVIALEQKGMTASRFTEQYLSQLNRRRRQYNGGLLKSTHDKQTFIDAAEQFWDIANGPRYTDYPPVYYLESLTEALESLGRHSEISIWIDRLHQWYTCLDAEEQRNEHFTFLGLLSYQLIQLHAFAPEQVSAYMQQYLPAVVAQAPKEDSGYLLYRFGWLHHTLQDTPQALKLYRLAEKSLLRDKDEDRNRQFLQLTRNGIADCTAKRKKPFWKFWA